MGKSLLKLAAALAMLLMAPPPARAQFAVIDPANLAQSIMQVTHMVEQVRNQVAQIEQAAAMLRANPLQLSPELSQSISEARSLFQSAQGMAFEARELGEDLRTLYPETWEQFDLEAVLGQSDRWMGESRQSLERAMAAEANAARSIERAQGQIDRALRSSAQSEGQTGATQAGNQLLGIQASQLAEIHALLAAQGAANRAHGAAGARRTRTRDSAPRLPDRIEPRRRARALRLRALRPGQWTRPKSIRSSINSWRWPIPVSG
jgi:type IV secretion system protein TrbJ